MSRAKGVQLVRTHTHTLVHKRADHSLVGVTRLWKSEGQSDWLSKTPDGLFI